MQSWPLTAGILTWFIMFLVPVTLNLSSMALASCPTAALQATTLQLSWGCSPAPPSQGVFPPLSAPLMLRIAVAAAPGGASQFAIGSSVCADIASLPGDVDAMHRCSMQGSPRSPSFSLMSAFLTRMEGYSCTLLDKIPAGAQAMSIGCCWELLEPLLTGNPFSFFLPKLHLASVPGSLHFRPLCHSACADCWARYSNGLLQNLFLRTKAQRYKGITCGPDWCVPSRHDDCLP